MVTTILAGMALLTESGGGVGTRLPHPWAAAGPQRCEVPLEHLLCSCHSPASPQLSLTVVLTPIALTQEVPPALRVAASRPPVKTHHRNHDSQLVGSVCAALPEGPRQPRRPDGFARGEDSTAVCRHQQRHGNLPWRGPVTAGTAETEARCGNRVTIRAKSSQITLFTNITADDSLLIYRVELFSSPAKIKCVLQKVPNRQK